MTFEHFTYLLRYTVRRVCSSGVTMTAHFEFGILNLELEHGSSAIMAAAIHCHLQKLVMKKMKMRNASKLRLN